MDVTRLRTAAALVALALLASACGARLTDEQRELVLRGGGGGGAVGGLPDDGLGDDPGGDMPTFDDADPGAEGAVVESQPVEPGAAGAVPDPGQPQQPGEQAPGGQPGQPRDTRAAPPGGNGGATDTGVSEDRIVIANVADVSGAVPGLFKDAQFAVQAYVAMFTATEGTLYGRRLEVLPLDSQLNTGGNRNQYIRACEQAFAAVGSMSAFEEGAEQPIRQCGIPDVRTAAVTPQIMSLDQVYGPQPLRTDVKRVTEWRYWAERHPDAVKRAGYLFIDSATTRWQNQQDQAATRTVGYHWEYVQPVDIAETNYAPFVLEMRTRDVKFVAFQGAYQQAVRLAQAMRQQNYWPDVYALQTNAYTPDLIAQGRGDVEGINIAVPSALLEEINANREMQEYARWLAQVRPDERPSGLGVYAWAAAKLFVEAAREVGPNLTRQRLLEQLRRTGEFDANGLIAPHHVGNRTPTTCVIVVQVDQGRFRRMEPAQGMRCDANGLARTP